MSDGADNPSYQVRRPGGDVDPSRIFNAPGIVLLIAGTTIIAFMIVAFAPASVARAIVQSAAVVPAIFVSGSAGNAGFLAMLAPLIAHMFVHAGIAHLLMNMFFLLAFGAPTARRMGAGGALQSSGAFAAASMFLTFYLLSGIVGALSFVALHPNDMVPMVGASGGVFGLLGGLVRFAFSRATLFGPDAAKFQPLNERSVVTWTVFVVATNNPVAAALLGPIFGGAGIAWEAHLGGYLFGLLSYPFFERAARGFR